MKLDSFLSSSQVRERYGVSDMWLWRRETEPDSKFPKPIRIHKRKFWRAAELDAWEHSLGEEAA